MDRTYSLLKGPILLLNLFARNMEKISILQCFCGNTQIVYFSGMKAATLNEIKQELTNLPSTRVLELCLRLGRFKKENKELLTYLLFEAHNIPEFIENIKIEIETQFDSINTSSVYFVKKSLRKILRLINKYSRYSGLANVEIELLVYFCTKINELKSSFKTNPVIFNIYQFQLKKINKVLITMHEDLQYDYQKQLDEL